MKDQNNHQFDADWDLLLEQLEQLEQSGHNLTPEQQVFLTDLRAIRSEAGQALKAYHAYSTDQKWNELLQHINTNEPVRQQEAQEVPLLQEQVSPRRNVKRLWYPLAGAAVLLLIFGLGWSFYQYRMNKQYVTGNIIKNDIAPGKQDATLTLADGRKISLTDASNGTLAQEAGVLITKNAEGQLLYTLKDHAAGSGTINTLSTANGQTYRVRLPDQSEVWLNASSSIRFPVSFSAAKERRVELTGEAYFEIAKDPKHPFIVKTSKQEVEVLGTHFNINSYDDRSVTRTTLLEGSIRISSEGSKGLPSVTKVVKPGEDAFVDADQQIRIAAADIRSVMAWKNGYFRFDNERIDEVFSKISRWYNIEVQYEGPMPEERFSGNMSRNKNISEVLDMLSYSKAVKFKVEGRRVMVMN